MRAALRRRVSSAKHWLDVREAANSAAHLGRETLIKYKNKLQPILPQEFFEKLESQDENDGTEFDGHLSRFLLQHSLSVPLATVANLHLQPGDSNYITWLFISAYFPVIAACLAPVGNLISFVGLLEHWQVNPETNRTIPDSHPVFALNVLAFCLGIMGNGALLLNFSRKLHYIVAQGVSICCFVVAIVLLTTAVLMAHSRIRHSMLVFSEGFWLAVFTIGLYALCTAVLVTNVIGYRLKKYLAQFNLDQKQRLLMSQTIAFGIWQAIGTVVMANLIPGITSGTSLYYCTVSMLTIGLGDVVPGSPGAKVFALVFSFVGVLIIGLIISLLREVILYSEGPSFFWHRIERKRVELLEEINRRSPEVEVLTPEGFALMRNMRWNVRRRQNRRGALLTFVVFVLFWLFGALILSSIEGWSYFNGVYFCGLCLSTIGYGDFHPQQPLGKAFFIVWAISAVPLMTILISNMGDTLFVFSGKLDVIALKLFDINTYKRLLGGRKYSAPDPDLERDPDGSSQLSSAVCESGTAGSATLTDPHKINQVRLTLDISDLLDLLKLLVKDWMDLPEKEYDYDEWQKHLRHLKMLDPDADGFWIGDMSPLKLPLRESNYLLLKMIAKIQRDLALLKQEQCLAFGGGNIAPTVSLETSSEDISVKGGLEDTAS